MPNNSSATKQSSPDHQPESSAPPTPKSLRTMIQPPTNDSDKKKQLKDIEISVPIVFGSVAFWLGKKASEFHHLKLYPEEESGPMTMKKPVVVETYYEIVFTEPSEVFFAHVQNHPALVVPRLPPGFSLPHPVQNEEIEKRKRGDNKDNPLTQWFTNFSEADELLKLAAARLQVQTHTARLRRQLSVIEGQQQLKSSSEM